MIFSAHQLQQKCIELGLDQCFIDLAKSFDTVNCEMLWKFLEEDCPLHFVTLVRSLHSDMNALVNFNSALTDPVSVVNGVKQGCVPAP